MKMGAAFFWGLILIILGFSVLIKVVFQIDIIRFVIAFFFIFLGIKMLVGITTKHHHREDGHAVFNKSYHSSINQKEYNLVFDSKLFDLRSQPKPTLKDNSVKFNTVFGSSTIIIPKEWAVKIKANAVFGNVEMPDKNRIVFGSGNYVNNINDEPALHIEGNVVFGQIEFKLK